MPPAAKATLPSVSANTAATCAGARPLIALHAALSVFEATALQSSDPHGALRQTYLQRPTFLRGQRHRPLVLDRPTACGSSIGHFEGGVMLRNRENQARLSTNLRLHELGICSHRHLNRLRNLPFNGLRLPLIHCLLQQMRLCPRSKPTPLLHVQVQGC